MYTNYSRATTRQSLLFTPSQIFSSLIADVQGARRSIDMEFYIYEDDHIGGAFARLLARKARQGVLVRLLLDGFGSRHIGRSLCNSLRDSGVVVCITSRMGSLRNHRKMAIIDGEIAYVGGVNIADRYVTGNSLGVWHDVELRIEGVEVERLVKIFEYDLMLYHGIVGNIATETKGAIDIYCTELQSSIVALFEDVLSSARRELIITTPYLFPTRRMVDQLRLVVERGVRVIIILPERCDVWPLDDIMRSIYSDVINVGVEIRLLRGAFVHSKMALVDRRRVVLGSANLDARSLHINRELMLSTSQERVCRSAYTYIRSLLNNATPPLSEELRGRIPRFLVEIARPYL